MNQLKHNSIIIIPISEYRNTTPRNEPVEHLPVTEDTINYVEITNDEFITKENNKASNMEFWDKFIDENENLFLPNSTSRASSTTRKLLELIELAL